jgi:ABC-type lipoprotein release transport system permease subunit
MWLYVKMAWRNIFRNKRRTIIAGIAIGIGLASLIFVDALVIGMERNMIHSATATFLGDGEIHRDGYRETREVGLTIEHVDSIITDVREESIVEHATARVMSFAMLSSPANVHAVNMVGIDPDHEPYLSQMDEALETGEYIKDSDGREMMIGRELAEVLEVDLGDRVVLTTAEARSGALVQEMFRITGIYFFNMQEMDRGMAFVGIGKSRDMLALGDEAHEIAFTFTDVSYGRDKNLPFWKTFSAGPNEAVGWTTLVPQLEAALEISGFMTYIGGLILFSVVALGIINTLFMSLYERMFEFGVMRAVGTSPVAMGRLIMFEAGALAVVSIVLGVILALIVTSIVAHTGIDYSGIEFAGVTFRELLYPVMTVKQFIEFPVWVFIITVVVGLYPAWHAARMQPARAMRKSI